MREEEDLQEPKKKFDEILRQQSLQQYQKVPSYSHFSHSIILPAK